MNTPNTEAFNPYAAPTADTHLPPGASLGEEEVGSYYAMGVAKLWIMSVLSFGLYNFAFFYRHFRHLRDHKQQDVSPFWRAFFSPFMYFGLNTQVKAAAEFAEVRTPALLGAAPIVYFVANLVSRAVDRMPDSGMELTLASFALVPVMTSALAATQTAANRVLQKEGYRGPVNDGPTTGSIVLGILSGLMWVTILLGSLVVF
ncbi:MAG: hypothetical protein ACRBN8_04770 [Nannocystales bacterium]